MPSDASLLTGETYAYEFGARADGSNASPKIMDAIAAADALGGERVVLAEGTFKLASPLFLNKWGPAGALTVPGLKLRGAGKNTTFLDTTIANGHAIVVNGAWHAASKSLFSIFPANGGTGTLVPNTTYFVLVTMNDGLGNEILATLGKSILMTGTSNDGRIYVQLEPLTTAPGFSYNIYVGTAAIPGNYAFVSGGNAVGLGGGQLVAIDAIGSAHTVPTDKRAMWQEAEMSDFSIINSAATTGAKGILYFRAGYATVDSVLFAGLTEGLTIPGYTGDIDGSFVVKVKDCKFDTISGWGINAAPFALEFSNFTVENCVFNLCGTLPSGYVNPLDYGSSGITISSISKANPGVFTTSTVHNFSDHDQVYLRAVGGMTQLTEGWYRVTLLTTTTFNLSDLNGAAIDTTSFSTYTPNSGRVMLAWRPPRYEKPTGTLAGTLLGSGGIAYMGLISTFRNLGFTQCKNVSMYFSENGSSDAVTMEGIDFENTEGKHLYIGCAVGGFWNQGELLSTNNPVNRFGAAISGVQLGTGFNAGGVKNFTINNIKVRSDVTPAVAFEQFRNTAIGSIYRDIVRVGGVEWQSYDVSGQVRFNGFAFDPIPGQVQFTITATNTARLIPIGYGGTLPLHLKATGEWVPYQVPDAGITTLVAGGLSPNASYNFWAYNAAATSVPFSVQLTATSSPTALNNGYKVSSADATLTFIGTWTTDGSGNFQSAGSGTSHYPPH